MQRTAAGIVERDPPQSAVGSTFVHAFLDQLPPAVDFSATAGAIKLNTNIDARKVLRVLISFFDLCVALVSTDTAWTVLPLRPRYRTVPDQHPCWP